MAVTVDQKIVQMKFDNKEFDDGVRDTMTLLEKFKLALGFNGASKGLEEIDKAAKKVDLSGLSQSASAVGAQFDAMQVMAITALANITNSAVNAGKQIVSSLTIDQVTSGFDKYEQKITSVQTIMNATGKSIDEVSAELEKLIWFTDETSYSFTDMVNNVGKFTSNQIELETAVRAMMGIADAAGLAGASVSDASHAMDGFSKAIAVGYMNRQNWQWIKTAHMDTAEFKRQLMEAAYQAGTLVKVGEDVYETIGKRTTVSIADFETAMSEGWLTTEAMLRTLDEFGGYAEQVYRLYDAGMATSTAIEKLSGTLSDVGEAGFKASQEAKTFTDAINAVKDAVSSGWMQTFEYIFGNKNEAVELWTNFTNELWEIFASGGERRNEVLAEWVDWEGRDKLIAALTEAYENVKKIIGSIRVAFTQMFPPYTVDTLKDLTLGFANLVKQLTPSEEALYTIYVVTKAILTPFRILFTIVKNVASVIGMLAIAGFKLVDMFLAMWAKGNPIVDLLKNIFGEERYARLAESFGKIIERIGNFFTPIVDSVRQLIEGQEELSPLATFMQKVLDILNKIGNVFLDFIVDGVERLANFDFTPIVNFFKSIGDFLKSGLDKGGDILSTMVSNFKALTSNLKGEKPANLIEGISNAITNLRSSFSNFLSSLGNTEAAQKAGVWISRLGDFLNSLGEALMRVIERLTPARILLYAFGISMVSLIYSVSGAVSSLSGVFESFSGVMDALASRIGTKASPIEEISKAIMMLVASVLILTMIDPEKLRAATEAIAPITISLAVLFAVISAVGMLAQKIPGIDFEKFDDSVRKLSTSLVLLGGAMALVSASLFLLDNADLQTIPVKLLIIGLVVAALSAVVFALTKMPQFENNAIAMVASIASIALGINLIVGALNKMEVGDWKTMVINLTGVTMILTALKGVLSNSYGVNFSSAMGLFVTILSLTSLAKALEKLAKFDTGVLIDGLLNFIPVFAALGSICIALGWLGTSMSKAASSIVRIGLGVLALSAVIKIISGMDQSEIIKDIAVIGAVLGFVTIFQLITSIASDEDGANLSKTLIGLGVALIAMSAAIAIIGTMRLDVVLQGTLVVGALIALMALVVLASRGAEKAGGTIISLMAAVLALSAAIALLSLLEPQEALVAVGSISALMLSLGATLKLISGGAFSVKGMLSLVEIVLLLLGLAYALNQLAKLGLANAIPNMLALSATMAALSACLIVLFKAAAIAKEAEVGWGEIGMISTLLVVMGGIGVAITAFLDQMPIRNPASTLTSLATFSAVIVGLTAVIAALSAVADKTKDIDLQSLGSIAGIMFIFGVVGLQITSTLSEIEISDPIGMLTTVASFSAVILALSGVMAILSAVGEMTNKMKPGSIVKIGTMMVVVSAIGTVLTWFLEQFIVIRDPTNMLITIASLSAVLLALSGVIVILSLVGELVNNLDPGSVGKISVLMLVLAAIGAGLVAILNLIEVNDPSGLLATVMTLSLALIALSAVVAVLGNVAKLVQGVNMAALAQLLGILAVTILVAGVIAGIASAVPLETIQNGGKVLLAIGEAIGNFIGGIIGGVVGGTVAGVVDSVAESLAGFVETAAPFIDLMTSGSGDKLLQGLGALTGLILGLTADSIVSGIMKLIGGDTSLTKFGEELTYFGEDFAYFAETLDATDVDVDKLTSLIEAATKITDFAAGIPPQDTDTLRAWIFGDTSMSSFGIGLTDFANGIARLSEKALDFDISDETIAAYKKVTDFASTIPAQGGGLKQWLLGDASLGTFGKELKTFSMYIADFDDDAKTFFISQSTVDSFARLAKFAGEIPAQPTWFDKWFAGGDTSLSKFSEELVEFGKNIAKYYKKVADIENPEILTACIEPISDIISIGTLQDISGFDLNVFTTVKQALDEMVNYPINGLPDFKDLGTKTLSYFIQGLRDTALRNSIKTNFENILIAIGKIFSDNQTANKTWGMDLVQNLINGINSESSRAVQTITDLCSAMAKAAEDALGIASPSTVFKALGAFVTEGLANGISENTKKAKDAITTVSNSIIDSFKSIFEIHSPSVVMDEMGHFIVQGLAEGITSDMSAVDAAKQMADNIVSAFKEGLDALSLDITTVDLEQQLWEALYGEDPRMTEEDIESKKLETLEKKMSLQAERVAYAEAQYKAVVQAVGEETEEAQTAYNTYLQEMITLTGLAKDILGDQTVEVKDQREALNDYILYMGAHKDALLSMGFALEEIEAAARESSGYLAGADPYENFKMVEDLVNEYLRDVTVELDTTVTDAIEAAIARDLEESVAEGVASAVSSGTTSGLEAGLSELEIPTTAYSYSVGSDFEDLMSDLMGNITGDEEVTSIFDGLFDPEAFQGSLANLFDIKLDFFNENASGFLDSIFDFGKNALNNFLSAWGIGVDGTSSEFEYAGECAMAGVNEGIVLGQKDVLTSVDHVSSLSLQTMANRLQINSPSKAFEELGMYAMMGLDVGINDEANSVYTSINTIGDTIGANLCSGLASGIQANSASVMAAANSVAMAAAQAMSSALMINSPSKLTEEMGMYFDMGFANGLTNYASYAREASEDVGTETVSGLNDAISEAASIAEDVLDGEPVIRPVLDLDSLKKDMAQISGMFSANQAIGIQTDMAKNQLGGKIQNGVDSEMNGGSNFTFVQNNYSPKALTRAEIYRQTNNQFAAFKERVSLSR